MKGTNSARILFPGILTKLGERSILLFDGECLMCDALVQFVLRQDSKQQFYFAALQSEAGQALLQHYGLPTSDMDSFVYVEEHRALLKSSAALTVLRRLGGLWAVLYVGIILPKRIRDWGYSQIAQRRYQWFGKKESCALPSLEQRKRFIETLKDMEELDESQNANSKA